MSPLQLQLHLQAQTSHGDPTCSRSPHTFTRCSLLICCGFGAGPPFPIGGLPFMDEAGCPLFEAIIATPLGGTPCLFMCGIAPPPGFPRGGIIFIGFPPPFIIAGFIIFPPPGVIIAGLMFIFPPPAIVMGSPAPWARQVFLLGCYC